MTSERRRIFRLRLVLGIVAGTVVGTMHALASHVMTREEPAASRVQYSVARPVDAHVAAR